MVGLGRLAAGRRRVRCCSPPNSDSDVLVPAAPAPERRGPRVRLRGAGPACAAAAGPARLGAPRCCTPARPAAAGLQSGGQGDGGRSSEVSRREPEAVSLRANPAQPFPVCSLLLEGKKVVRKLRFAENRESRSRRVPGSTDHTYCLYPSTWLLHLSSNLMP